MQVHNLVLSRSLGNTTRSFNARGGGPAPSSQGAYWLIKSYRSSYALSCGMLDVKDARGMWFISMIN